MAQMVPLYVCIVHLLSSISYPRNGTLTSSPTTDLLTVPFVLATFLAWTLIPSNVAGRTKKTLISSCTFLGYCVGNMTGSQIFKTKDAPRYVPGTIGCVVCLGAEIVLVVSWRFYYMYMNKKRDKLALESGVSKEEQERLGRELGERDVTDLNNPWFRYTL